jgi:hypothetical protein
MNMKVKEENTRTGICYVQKIAHNRYLAQFFVCDNIIIYHELYEV